MLDITIFLVEIAECLVVIGLDKVKERSGVSDMYFTIYIHLFISVANGRPRNFRLKVL